MNFMQYVKKRLMSDGRVLSHHADEIIAAAIADPAVLPSMNGRWTDCINDYDPIIADTVYRGMWRYAYKWFVDNTVIGYTIT